MSSTFIRFEIERSMQGTLAGGSLDQTSANTLPAHPLRL